MSVVMQEEVRTRSESRSRVVDWATAQKMLEECPFEYQRRIDVKHVKRYRQDQLNGTFDAGSQIKLVELPTGEMYLIDGYSRLSAQLETKVAVEYAVTTIRVRDMEEARRLYTNTDTGRNRNMADMDRVMGISSEIGINSMYVKQLHAAAHIIADGFTCDGHKRVLSMDGMRQLILFWKREASAYFDILDSQKPGKTLKGKMTTSICMSLALITLKHQPELATKFWSEIAGFLQGTKSTNNVTIGAVVDTLLNYKRGSSIDEKLTIRKLANAWAAYAEGRTISRTNAKGKRRTANVAIWGTPFTSTHNPKLIGLPRNTQL